MWVLIQVLSKWVSTCVLPWGAKSCFFEHRALTVNKYIEHAYRNWGQANVFLCLHLCAPCMQTAHELFFHRISPPHPPQPTMGITYFNMTILFLEGSVNSYSFFGFHTQAKKDPLSPKYIYFIDSKVGFQHRAFSVARKSEDSQSGV